MTTVRLEIIEQPKQRGMRFRYECEGRSAGSIPGENTTTDKKTWPACQITNYQGMAVIRVSLVSKDDPFRPHPHSLVGRDCNNGICQITIDPSSQMQGLFPNLGIQCVRRKEVSAAIRERLKLGVNPFDANVNGDERSAIDVDLNIVRLCFEAFLPDHHGNYTQRLQPVVSNPIYDKKATSSSVLKICRVDRTAGSVHGKEEVFLLCDKVQKEDIQVVFSHEGWEALGDFSSPDVHRQVAIVFKTPPYRDELIQESVDVEVKLRRPSDMETSDPLIFTYIPVQQNYVFHGKPLLPNSLMAHPGPNPLHSRFREAIMNKAKRAHPSDARGDRVPMKRPSPMPMHVMRPNPNRHFSPPPHSFMARPLQRPSMNVPHHSSIKKESTSEFAAFPSPQPSFVSTAGASTSHFSSMYTAPAAVPTPATSASLFPSINHNITEASTLNFYDFGINLESLPSLSSLPSLDGPAEALQSSVLTATTSSNNFPKIEEPYIDNEIPILDTLMQNCSIEKIDPGNINFVQMLGEAPEDPNTGFISAPSNVFDAMPQQQGVMSSSSMIQQQARDARLFSPPPQQMPSPSVTPHHQTSIMSPHAVINSHHTGSHYSSAVAANSGYTSSNVVSPPPMMNVMSPHANVMSPPATATVMSPPPTHSRTAVMSPVSMAGMTSQQFHPGMAHMPGSYSRLPHQNFIMRNNNNQNNNHQMANNLLPGANNLQSGENSDSLDEILKNFT